MLWRYCKRVLLGFAGLSSLLLITGSFFQFISTHRDAVKYPAPGQMVDMGGYKMHYYSMGSGGPAVILDSGLGCISSDWALVQEEASKFTQVVSYDRAGIGWSEPHGTKRTSEQIVLELHELLEKAGIPKPYILVGHSFGGNNVQLYATKYPDEVAGVILVDSCHDQQEKSLPQYPFDHWISYLEKPEVARITAAIGINRLLAHLFLSDKMDTVPQWIKDTHFALCTTTKHSVTVGHESQLISKSLKELELSDRSICKDKPCYVLSAGLKTDLSIFGFTLEEQDKMHRTWLELQQDLTRKYSKSEYILAEKSNHMIQWHEPELVVDAIKKMVNQCNE